MAKPALGRGLGALLGGAALATKPVTTSTDQAAATPAGPPSDGLERVVKVPLSRIRPCPFQPRKDFPPEALRELADSIREQGVVQPLIVRPRGGDYELIAGERRWRAAELCGLVEVPVLVREAEDAAALELALIENLQRENLNPLEEAQGYQQLIDQFHLRQEDVAVKVGKSRVAVANALRLLKLPAELQALVRAGQMSVGHAKVILGLPGPQEQRAVATRVLKAGLNVRQTEELVARRLQAVATSNDRAAGGRASPGADVHVRALETRLREKFGAKVQLRYRQGKGAIEIHFFNDDDLERILQIVGVHAD